MTEKRKIIASTYILFLLGLMFEFVSYGLHEDAKHQEVSNATYVVSDIAAIIGIIFFLLTFFYIYTAIKDLNALKGLEY